MLDTNHPQYKNPSKKFPKDVLIIFLDKSTFELFAIHVCLWRWWVGIECGSEVDGSPKLTGRTSYRVGCSVGVLLARWSLVSTGHDVIWKRWRLSAKV
jgi:hypothetical protein